jgi:hypothetical protein
MIFPTVINSSFNHTHSFHISHLISTTLKISRALDHLGWAVVALSTSVTRRSDQMVLLAPRPSSHIHQHSLYSGPVCVPCVGAWVSRERRGFLYVLGDKCSLLLVYINYTPPLEGGSYTIRILNVS